MRYVTAVGVFFVVLAACAQKHEVGEPCLNNIDCETSYCLAGHCAAKPTQNTTKPPVPAAIDAAVDAPAPDAAPDPRDAGDAEAGAPRDASPDAPAGS